LLLKITFSGNRVINYDFLEKPVFSINRNLYTDQEILNKEKLDYEVSKKNLFKLIENDVSGVILEDGEFSMFSAKFSKSRIYYVADKNSMFVSFDLRKLLQYSSKRINLQSLFSIIKFGEIPERLNLIYGIFSIPSNSFTTINPNELRIIIRDGYISTKKIFYYNYINYTYSGGDLHKTKNTLLSSLELVDKYNPLFFASGGVDSSLLIQMYYQLTGKKINAHFLHFAEANSELEHVKSSLKGTNYDLLIKEIKSENFINDFESSIRHLIYPVYDNGSAFTGYKMFEGIEANNDVFIDGSLADSCYGVRNYNNKLIEGKKQSIVKSLVKEWIYFHLSKAGLADNLSKPRDTHISSVFIQDLLWNSGYFTNFWFKSAKGFSESIEKELLNYTSLSRSPLDKDYWADYTVIKMCFYAGKQTSVKSYDMRGQNQIFYPFMFNQVINDQGNYTWSEKSINNQSKYPLKKLLEDYLPKSFIYRKKQGLQSQTVKWMLEKNNKRYFINLMEKNKVLGHRLMGKNYVNLINLYKNDKTAKLAVKNVLSLCVIGRWMDFHQIDC